MDESQKPKVEIDKGQERLWNTLCHLTALAVFIGIPFGNIIGPLVIWLIKRHDIASVNDHGKEALNFQISMSIYALVTIPLTIILIGIPLFIALAITDLILVIIASVKANNGEFFSYPLTIRFIK